METDIVETDSDLSASKIIVICATALAVGMGTKVLVGKVRTKLAERRNQDKTHTVVETD